MKILCVDPGPDSCGFAIINTDSWVVTDYGQGGWDYLINLLDQGQFDGVAVEEMISYRGVYNTKTVIGTAFQLGRLFQVVHELKIDFRQASRKTIIKHLTGKSVYGTKKGLKAITVSKTDMQVAVQKILNLDKPIRPQHANDAVCAGLALWHHPAVIVPVPPLKPKTKPVKHRLKKPPKVA